MIVYALPAALLLLSTQAVEEPVPPAIQEMTEVAVVAPEPRFVAPTRRDRIGRIWAPVLVNGQGPFRLVLDTGATKSALTAKVAEALGISLDYPGTIMLQGATGSVMVPAIPVESLEVGELLMQPKLFVICNVTL